MDKKALAIGIVVGVLIVGCLAAIDCPDKDGEARYEFLEGISTNTNFFVLDSETGTVNQHDGTATFVYPFVTE